MDGVFSGVATANVERFFGSLVAYDVTMPHTNTRLSPLNFQMFLARNNILCINQQQVYDAANRFWRRYISFTPGVLDKCQNPYSLSICEEEKPGWNKLVDYLNRLLCVQDFNDHLYYKMHYIAHICYLFSNETFPDVNSGNCQKAIFNEIIQDVTYERLIPTNNLAWIPVLNHADARFCEGVTMACAKASHFIETHCARTMNNKEYDISRLVALKEIVTSGLTAMYDKKYEGEMWKAGFIECLARASLVNTDMEMCELKDSFNRDGMKCCKVLNKLIKARTLFEKNMINDDPETATDYLLDAYTLINKGLQSYNIPTDKEKKTEGKVK